MSFKNNIQQWLKPSYLKGVLNSQQIPFILFLSVLAIFSIRSGHSVDEKVHEISKLESELKELEAEYLESKSMIMQLGMESEVIKQGLKQGLIQSEEPPIKLVSESD
jgi:hypothetical protein